MTTLGHKAVHDHDHVYVHDHDHEHVVVDVNVGVDVIVNVVGFQNLDSEVCFQKIFKVSVCRELQKNNEQNSTFLTTDSIFAP